MVPFMKRWKWPLCVLLEDEVHEVLAVIVGEVEGIVVTEP